MDYLTDLLTTGNLVILAISLSIV